MSQLKTKDIESALLRKGYKLEETHHHYYRLSDQDGKKTKVKTKISHGEKEIKDPLINSMSKQVHLTKQEFLSYVACHLSLGEYYRILKSKNLI